MSEIKNTDSTTQTFDPLDMNNDRVEKLKKADKKGFERWMEIFGGPLAIISFLLIYYWADISFLNEFNVDALKDDNLALMKAVKGHRKKLARQAAAQF